MRKCTPANGALHYVQAKTKHERHPVNRSQTNARAARWGYLQLGGGDKHIRVR
eukprot:gene4440-3664_t